MDLGSYQDLLARKRVSFEPRGLARVPALNDKMFPHQAHTTEFLLRSGCGAAFLDTGLGKSLVALEWGRVISEHAGKPVLMLAPLAVGPQHQREAEKFGIEAEYQREPGRRVPIVITNYERVDKFDLDQFAGVILDESSILKSFTGATTRKLIEAFKRMPYRLACTATPAPNDHMELGQQAAFLGIMPAFEMLMRWFINDTSTASQQWRLKGHAEEDFWDWLASWARMAQSPADLGFDDAGYILPALEIIRHRTVGDVKPQDGALFAADVSATTMHDTKRQTIAARADAAAAIVAAEPDEAWLIWCDTDYEASAISAAISGTVEVRGSHSIDAKEERIGAFLSGEEKRLLSKPSICGYGLNAQHCARQIFVGRTFSYELWYQAVRRSWRFGQTRPVHVHLIVAEGEDQIGRVIDRKAGDHAKMKAAMAQAMRRAMHRSAITRAPYNPTHEGRLPAWLRSVA